MAQIANRIGRKNTYMISLLLGGAGLISMIFIHNQYGLIISMVGIGIAWAAILAMAILLPISIALIRDSAPIGIMPIWFISAIRKGYE